MGVGLLIFRACRTKMDKSALRENRYPDARIEANPISEC